MNNEQLVKLARQSFAKDIQIAMLQKENEGLIINREVVEEILKEHE